MARNGEGMSRDGATSRYGGTGMARSKHLGFVRAGLLKRVEHLKLIPCTVASEIM